VRFVRRGVVTALLAVAAFACGPTDATPPAGGAAGPADRASDVAAVQQAALTELFLVRERASALLLWRDSVHTGPILDSLGLGAALEVTVPTALVVSRVSLTDIESLFARHPDGWAALYATYPGTPGLVEVGPVAFDDDARSAQITVGRSCGENCRMAWQVTLAVQDDRAWRVRDVGPVRPR
jgi:hypothetical protein